MKFAVNRAEESRVSAMLAAKIRSLEFLTKRSNPNHSIVCVPIVGETLFNSFQRYSAADRKATTDSSSVILRAVKISMIDIVN